METQEHEKGIGDCSKVVLNTTTTALPTANRGISRAVGKRGHVAAIVILTILLVVVLGVFAVYYFCGCRHALCQIFACCPCTEERSFDMMTNEVRAESNPVYDHGLGHASSSGEQQQQQGSTSGSGNAGSSVVNNGARGVLLMQGADDYHISI